MSITQEDLRRRGLLGQSPLGQLQPQQNDPMANADQMALQPQLDQRPQALQDFSKVAQTPMPIPHVAGPAPGSSLYDNDPSRVPPPSFKDVTGIDPTSQIKAMMAAQNEQAAASSQMTQAQNMNVSPLRGLLGTALGAGIGALSPRNAAQGAQLGQSIIEAPQKIAMGLASSRAAAAKTKFDDSEKIGEAVDKAQGRFGDTQELARRAAEDASTNTYHQGELAVQNRNATTNEGELQARLHPAVKPDVEIKVDPKSGKVYAIDKNASSPSEMAKEIPGLDLGPDPKAVGAFNTIYAEWLGANQNATSEAKQAKAMAIATEIARAGATSLDLHDRVKSEADTEAENVGGMVTAIANRPDVQAALKAGDANTYTRLVEGYLARTNAQFKQYVPKTRQDLLSHLPKALPKTDPIDELIKGLTAPK